MDIAVFERITHECSKQNCMLWLHFLGEPLLHRHALDFIRMAKRHGCRVGLSTNAVALQTYAEQLLDSGLDRLECSIDAADRSTYEAMRGRDHFERVSENIRDFLERKRRRHADLPVTSLQLMRTDELVEQLPSIRQTWEPLLGPRDFIMTIEPITFGGAIRVPAMACDELPRPPCSWLFESLMILQDGTVTMCGTDWDASAPLGNVRHSSVTEIWEGAELARRRLAHQEGRFHDVAPCTNCRDWAWADGHGYQNARPSSRT